MNAMDRLSSLVDLDEGVVGREIFVSDELFEAELERIFMRAWLFIGHEDMVPNNNDYFVSRMGKDSVILTRDSSGEVHVLLNTCTHRGMKLCRYDAGNTRNFVCPYHGWSFSTDGRLVERPGELVGVPNFKTAYRSELDKKRWGLIAVPRVHNFKGTIWASWDPDAPDFLDYLGDMRHYLDFALDYRDGRPAGSEMIGGVLKWRVKANWKLAPENFIGDLYHDVSHRSVDLVGISPSGGRGRRDASPDRMTLCFPKLGHGVIGQMPFYDEAKPSVGQWKGDPEIEEYYAEVYRRREERFGDGMRVAMSVGTIFPSMSFHGRQPRTIAWFHPISPTEMEMWRIFLVDKDAPQKVKDQAREYYLKYSGPGGMTESDDMENWSYATEASVGAASRQMFFNYQMGLGHARPVAGLQDAVENGEYTEENARAYYRRWLEFMKAGSWKEIGTASRPGGMEP
ncbi:MAG TPA: aromatic ring-hydroxylating dioxygenase subunit alpha [Actinomycetales bacterium]|nr:aromatic ring-hydroxylating dioxygenase subunit alpha [Actinomycetales bacterium]